jgi:hypothetical protein
MSPSGTSAATPSACSTGAGIPASRARKSASSRSSTGSTGGRGASPARWAGERPRTPSMRARGLPWVSSQQRSATAGATPCADSSSTAASASSPGRSRRGKRVWSSRHGTPVRWANTTPTRSAEQRWAAKISVSRLARSIQWLSSTSTAIGRSTAACDSNDSAAPYTVSAGPSACSSPSAPRSERAWTSVNPSTRSSSGRSTAVSPANASSLSNSMPVARRTVIPRSAASPAVHSASAVLPWPASPRSTSTDARPAAALSRRRASAASSGPRPTGARADLPPWSGMPAPEMFGPTRRGC